MATAPASTTSKRTTSSKAAASASKKSTTNATTPAQADPATKLLMQDHAKVKKLFKQFEKLKDKGSAADKQAIVLQACTELKIHTQVEEQIFYPAVKAVLGKDADMIDEASVEHASCKDLIAQLEAASPEDELYDAKFIVLSEFIEHHVEEEEEELFPKVRKIKSLDLAALGKQMKALKEELTASVLPH